MERNSDNEYLDLESVSTVALNYCWTPIHSFTYLFRLGPEHLQYLAHRQTRGRFRRPDFEKVA